MKIALDNIENLLQKKQIEMAFERSKEIFHEINSKKINQGERLISLKRIYYLFEHYGQYKKAKELLNDILKVFPNEISLKVIEIVLETKFKNKEKSLKLAKKLYERLEKSESDEEDEANIINAYKTLIWAYQYMYHFEDMFQTISHAIKQFPDNLDITLSQIKALIAIKEFSNAKEVIANAKKKAKTNEDLWNLLYEESIIEFKLGNFGKAIELLAEIPESKVDNSKFVKIKTLKAKCYIEKNQYSNAKSILLNIKLSKSDDEVLSSLLICYENLNELDAAHKLIKNNTQLIYNAEMQSFSFAVVKFYMNKKQFDKAEAVIRKMKQTTSKISERTILYMTCLLAHTDPRSKRETIINNYKTFLSKYPYEETAYTNLAVYLNLCKRFDESKEIIEKAKKYYPRSINIRLIEANIATQKGEHEDTIQLYSEAIEELGNHKKFLLGRSIAYYSMQKWGEALKDVEEALKIDENYASAWAQKGHIYNHMKELSRYKKNDCSQKAIECFDKARKLNPKRIVRHQIYDIEPMVQSIPNEYAIKTISDTFDELKTEYHQWLNLKKTGRKFTGWEHFRFYLMDHQQKTEEENDVDNKICELEEILNKFEIFSKEIDDVFIKILRTIKNKLKNQMMPLSSFRLLVETTFENAKTLHEILRIRKKLIEINPKIEKSVDQSIKLKLNEITFQTFDSVQKLKKELNMLLGASKVDKTGGNNFKLKFLQSKKGSIPTEISNKKIEFVN